MESGPNLNLNIEVHQATFDKSLNLLSLNCQFFINFSGFSVKSRTVSEVSPVWNQSFNFEYNEGGIEITFLHNPLILKEILLGKSLIPAKDCSGWFDIRNICGKIGSVRISIKTEGENNSNDDEYRFKIMQLQIVVDELKRAREKYLKRLEKLKKYEKNHSRGESGSFLELSTRDFSLLAKIRYQLKLKEESLACQRSEIENSWKNIEMEKRNLALMQNKVQGFDGKSLRERCPKADVLTPLTCPRTPMSAKYSNLSDLSLTQPRSANGIESEHLLSTPKSKLIKFE
jgi:hypothetical protein